MGHLFDKICDIDTLKAAWQHVLQKNSRGGLDEIQPSELRSDIDKKLSALSSDLKERNYKPVPYAGGKTPKFNEKKDDPLKSDKLWTYLNIIRTGLSYAELGRVQSGISWNFSGPCCQTAFT